MRQRPRIWIAGLALLFCACDELARDNPLDPGNPRSERRRVILIEAFVNEATPFSPFAAAALDSLANVFSTDALIIAEHHLPSTSFVDQNALAESLERYANLTAVNRGVPDVFFNGSSTRVQGASSMQTALARYRDTIDRIAGAVSHFTIEADKKTSGARIDLDVTIARLGDREFSQFSVCAVIWEDLGTSHRHRVVRKVVAHQIFNSIAPGEKKVMSFSAQVPVALDPGRLSAAVFVEQNTSSGREILQVALAE